ncbi:unnamed protein product, partial [Mesorhabditis belari]|uniref:Mitochondrial fission factor n=1 Tax=Mesorhabditis belari TaxID=2138241 RepID=A0AAF3EEH9_9BILA
MNVPQHIGVMGDAKYIPNGTIKSDAKWQERDQIVEKMHVPERLMVAGGNDVRGASAPPMEVLLDRMPDVVKRTSMQFDLPETLTLDRTSFPDVIEPKHDDSRSAASIAIDDNPLQEIKLMRRQLTTLSARVYQMEEEYERRRSRETLQWFLTLAGAVGVLMLSILRR